MSNDWFDKFQQQQQADELARQTRAIKQQSASLERQAESNEVIADHLQSLKSCVWCGRLGKLNPIGYCGVKCGYEHLGEEGFRRRMLESDEKIAREQQRRKPEAESRMDGLERPAAATSFWSAVWNFGGGVFLFYLLAKYLWKCEI